VDVGSLLESASKEIPCKININTVVDKMAIH
jgi:hypothetical protein